MGTVQEEVTKQPPVVEGEKKKKKKKKRKKKNKNVDEGGAVKLSKRKLKSMAFLEKHGISIRCYKCKRAGHQKQNCPGYQKDSEEVKDKICFKCRDIGHVMEMCPLLKAANAEQDDGWGGKRKRKTAQVSCYNCGSEGHASKVCREPKIGNGVSYATCFICSEVGHLSSQCAKSKVGIYPHGGCCHQCKSIYHLIKDCPEKEKEATYKDESGSQSQPKAKKQKSKVVSF